MVNVNTNGMRIHSGTIRLSFNGVRSVGPFVDTRTVKVRAKPNIFIRRTTIGQRDGSLFIGNPSHERRYRNGDYHFDTCSQYVHLHTNLFCVLVPEKLWSSMKIPHLCPKCSGERNIAEKLTRRTCPTCSGEGVLWREEPGIAYPVFHYYPPKFTTGGTMVDPMPVVADPEPSQDFPF